VENTPLVRHERTGERHVRRGARVAA